MKKKLARELLNLPKDIPIVAFGTYGANSQYIKGFDLLLDALKNLKGKIDGMELAIFGQHQKILSVLVFQLILWVT